MEKLKKIEWHTEKRKLSELIPFENNPRILKEKSYKDLKQSLSKFNLAEIPAINTDNKIIAGHQRLKILYELNGDIEIDVRVPNRELTKKEFEEYNIRSNKNVGDWDFDILANNFELNDLIDWGFEERELFKYFDEIKEDEIPEVPKETNIKPGNLFKLNNHYLLCGDSTLKENINILIKYAMPDIIFTDPPYDMEFNLLDKCFENIQGLGQVQFWMGSDKQLTKLVAKYEKEFTHFFVQDFINATMISGSQPMQQHTLIAKFGNKKLKNLKDGFSTIVKVQTNRIKKEHDIFSMGKNVELPAKFISHYCDNIVLDIFGGYGSTLIAAEQLNKQCLMIELNPYYCDLIIQRWQNFTNEKIELLN